MLKIFKVAQNQQQYSMKDEVSVDEYIATISAMPKKDFSRFYMRQSTDGGKTWDDYKMEDWIKSKNPQYRFVVCSEDEEYEDAVVLLEDSNWDDLQPVGSPPLILYKYKDAHLVNLETGNLMYDHGLHMFMQRSLDNGETWHYYDGHEWIDGAPAWTKNI